MTPNEPRAGTVPGEDAAPESPSGQDQQVSEVQNLDPDKRETEGYPDQAVAGYPDTESGEPQEGTAGPNARPRDDSYGGGPDNDH